MSVCVKPSEAQIRVQLQPSLDRCVFFDDVLGIRRNFASTNVIRSVMRFARVTRSYYVCGISVKIIEGGKQMLKRKAKLISN